MYRLTIEARYDPTLQATLRRGRPLRYGVAPDRAMDVPPHVRAASALRRLGRRLVVVQDDVNAFAVLDTSTAAVTPILLPASPEGSRVFDDARGNKDRKMDLEASVALPDGRLVAFGSGSSRLRERLVVLSTDLVSATIVDAAPLYDILRTAAIAHGAELNVEGATAQGDRLWLAQRGHGKRLTSRWNALIGLPLPGLMDWMDRGGTTPSINAIVEVRIGTSAQGVPFGFTDATANDDGRLAFVACAEDSPDVRSDGALHGCRFGWLDLTCGDSVVADVLEVDGQPTVLKLEGIEPRPGCPDLFDVVADMDRPDEPAALAELCVTS